MKKLLLSLAFVLSLGLSVMAQQNEYEYLKTQFSADRKTLLMSYLKLSETDAAKFWPIYANYEKERSQLGDQRFANLKNYAAQYATLTPEQAEQFEKNYFAFRGKEASIQKKYFAQLKKAVGTKTAYAWLQFEDYIDTAVRFEVLSNIPFVNEK
jgi:Spy/CpxP family protein refolding chaperone